MDLASGGDERGAVPRPDARAGGEPVHREYGEHGSAEGDPDGGGSDEIATSGAAPEVIR
ncbi:hypothetical protein ACIODW_12085 [Streptomyces sp. NPDC087897]|uniref:hypothetical protein n=1 Tax=Streptomyces sp. NPDC087897 TaxID=3365817 RepID=UPI003821CF54